MCNKILVEFSRKNQKKVPYKLTKNCTFDIFMLISLIKTVKSRARQVNAFTILSLGRWRLISNIFLYISSFLCIYSKKHLLKCMQILQNDHQAKRSNVIKKQQSISDYDATIFPLYELWRSTSEITTKKFNILCLLIFT